MSLAFFDKSIDSLRNSVGSLLSENRFLHTLGVEEMAVALARLLVPEKASELAAAALLHDISKEIPYEEQLRLLKEEKFPLTPSDIASPKVLHSYTAPIVIKRDFSQFATEDILSAVFKHTLGDPEMTTFDKIIFLADFIEKNRKNEGSVILRQRVFSQMKENDFSSNLKILDEACLFEIDNTISYLKSRNGSIHKKTLLAKASLTAK